MKINSTSIVTTFMLFSLIFVVLFFAFNDFRNLIAYFVEEKPKQAQIAKNEVEEKPTRPIVEQYAIDNKPKQAQITKNEEVKKLDEYQNSSNNEIANMLNTIEVDEVAQCGMANSAVYKYTIIELGKNPANDEALKKHLSASDALIQILKYVRDNKLEIRQNQQEFDQLGASYEEEFYNPSNFKYTVAKYEQCLKVFTPIGKTLMREGVIKYVRY